MSTFNIVATARGARRRMARRGFGPVPARIVSALQRALQRLEASAAGGDLMRRNARAAYRRAVASLDRVVDARWPAPRRRVKRRTKMTEAKLRAAGFVPCTADERRLRAFTEAGVRTRRGPNGVAWVKSWAMELPPDPKLLAEAKRSKRRRDALLAQQRIAGASLDAP